MVNLFGSSDEARIKRLLDLRWNLTKRGYKKWDKDKGFLRAYNKAAMTFNINTEKANEKNPFVLTNNLIFTPLFCLIGPIGKLLPKLKLSQIFPQPPILCFLRPLSLTDL